MKAPDKIYIEHEYTDNATLPCGVNWENRTNDNDICYIRKDALVEWAKERRKQMKIEAGGCWSMHATGEYMAMDKLIEKLESM